MMDYFSYLNELDDLEERKTSCGSDWITIFSIFPCTTLFLTEFLVIFNQTTIESLLTPMTLMWYNFGQLENSILFACITIIIIVFLVMMGPLTRCMEDRALLMTGHLMTGASIT